MSEWFNLESRFPIRLGSVQTDHVTRQIDAAWETFVDQLESGLNMRLRKKKRSPLQFVSPHVHGVLDYLSAGTLLLLPRVFGLSRDVTRLLTGAALLTFVYSMLTRYPSGVVKVLPMRAHLLMDGLSGLVLTAAPALLPDEDPRVTAMLVSLGVFEIGAALTTDPQDD